MTELIRIEKIIKVFHSRKGEVHALGALEFSIESGEFVSCLGPSGCGKTTLLMVIAGLIKPTGGKVSIGGNIVDRPQTNVGIVFQDPVLVDWRDILGNVLLQIEMRNLEISDYKEKAKDLLASVGLKDFLKHHPYELSGGMKQRTAFCRALIHDPPLILMDEPLGALDAMTRSKLRRDLEKLWSKTKKTFLYVTHDIAEAIQLSDKIIVMSPRPGKIVKIIDIKLPRPRGYEVLESTQFIEYNREIKEIFMEYGAI